MIISNPENDTIGHIKYQATWIYNKKEFLQNLLQTMNEEREDLIREIRNQDKKLQLIAKPFGAYINIIDIDDLHFEDKYLSQNVKQKLAVTPFEEAFSLQFNLVVAKMGFRDTQWGRLAIIMFAIWCVSICFVCFYKADFLNLTIGVVGLYLLLDPQTIKFSYLRLLIFALPLSMIYDVVWLVQKTREYWIETEEGGIAQVILGFVYFLIFYKILLIIVMWRASINFKKFI